MFWSELGLSGGINSAHTSAANRFRLLITHCRLNLASNNNILCKLSIIRQFTVFFLQTISYAHFIVLKRISCQQVGSTNRKFANLDRQPLLVFNHGLFDELCLEMFSAWSTCEVGTHNQTKCCTPSCLPCCGMMYLPVCVIM
jgi:hypothetical protein